MSSDATDNTMRAELLPRPDRAYADHSYPAYSPALVQRIVAEAVAAEREACAALCENLRDTSDVLGEVESADAFDTASTAIRSRRLPAAPKATEAK